MWRGACQSSNDGLLYANSSADNLAGAAHTRCVLEAVLPRLHEAGHGLLLTRWTLSTHVISATSVVMYTSVGATA